MSKPLVEFTPVDDVAFTQVTNAPEGVLEYVIARDADSGAVTRLLRFFPGVDTSSQGPACHDYWEELFILEGSLTDLTLERTFTQGSVATRPPGTEHGPWITTEGVLFFEVQYFR